MAYIDASLKKKAVRHPEQPRERLVQYGVKALSNQELLAILLRTGTREQSVMDLAGQFLACFSCLNDLKQASLEEFQSIKGIGRVKAIELKAAIELGSRVHISNLPRYGIATSTQKVGQWLIQEMGDLQQEHLVSLCLNTKNEVIRKQTVFIGSLASSVAHPREIFKEAVKYPTARIILAHNHPSGNPDPSPADLYFTKRMIACGDMMGIELLDHIIIGNGIYHSIRETSNLFD
ncbi:RadC family protein [Facklamia hominis]|uniref:DNA repair protein RadC n=1 Tax=Facklamia hominis CCUG 36813 TaxID=883111 RepID=K1LNS2_9LACT|nr:DNA repair protein RadC [Facklamia hominis]EKB56416.1 DNA repair protein RadC [Facklamia hominis CCUG 36813]EPH12821.1 DNA repair protein RadC [Facklamia hominis ACS-120-V-Sch10]RYC98925.1 JAB domain-containing protein [Facklamia hominis]